jgi:hypothetical protein
MNNFTKESLIDHSLVDGRLCCPLTMDQINDILYHQEFVNTINKEWDRIDVDISAPEDCYKICKLIQEKKRLYGAYPRV